MSVSKIDLHKFDIECPFVNCIDVRCAETYAAGILALQTQYVCQCESEPPQKTAKRLMEILQ